MIGRAAPRVVVAPRVRVAPVRFYQPYYTFRPRVSIGFGLWLGFPIRYSYSYGYYDPFYYPPYGYAYPAAGYPSYPVVAYPPSAYPPAAYPPPYPPSAYPQPGYPPNGAVPPGQANMGGMSFEITPGNAEVFVDGQYVGMANEFSPTSQPLGLAPGRHQIEIRAAGYRTMMFDADILAGEVLPYQGALAR